jgi:hypothetical protein
MRSRARRNPIQFSAGSFIVEIPDDEVIIEASFLNYFWVPESPFVDRGDCFQNSVVRKSFERLFVGQASLARFFSRYTDRFRRQPIYQALKFRREGTILTVQGNPVTGDRLYVYSIGPTDDHIEAEPRFSILTRKISALEALTLGIAKENPRKRFPDRLEIYRLGVVDLPADLEISSISFVFTGEFAEISLRPQGLDLGFYCIDSRSGIGQFMPMAKILQKVSSVIFEHGFAATLDAGAVDVFLGSFTKGRLYASKGLRTDIAIIYAGDAAIGNLIVVGEVLSPLEALVRGTEKNPRGRR